MPSASRSTSVPELNIEAWNLLSGNLIEDIYVGPYEQIGVTDNSFFADYTVQPGKRYMYYVVQEHQRRTSDQSNLAAFPLLTPPMTFSQLLRDVGTLEARGRLTDAARLRAQVLEARNAAAYCRIDRASKLLSPQAASNLALFPESIDLEIMMSKLERRLTLYGKFPSDFIAAEFCVS